MLNLTQRQEEVWKPVRGFEKFYQVSSLGRVSNYKKILKTYVINSGYKCLKLHMDSKRTSVLLHRVVAETFMDNPEGKKVVNHKDGNISNNQVSNLEWVTAKENIDHAKKLGRMVYNVPTLGLRIGKTSKYHNVTKVRNSFIATIRVNGKNMFSKSFRDEDSAALHVNWIIDKLKLTGRPKNIVEVNA